jgi:hypothetical protein
VSTNATSTRFRHALRSHRSCDTPHPIATTQT